MCDATSGVRPPRTLAVHCMPLRLQSLQSTYAVASLSGFCKFTGPKRSRTPRAMRTKMVEAT